MHLRQLGMSDKAIARALGVTDKTVAKAVHAAASPGESAFLGEKK
jgi:DNA-binding NarL/FixJ family response regulator